MGGRSLGTIGRWGLCLLVLGCAPSYLDAYRARHPGWEPSLPQLGIGLEEVLASLHRENPEETISVEIAWLEVLRPDGESLAATPFEEIRSGRAPLLPEQDSVVLVELACSHNPGLAPQTRRRWGLYVLPKGRLEGWDHPTFKEDCVSSSEFLPARGAAVALEQGGMAELRARGGRVAVGLEDAYRRGSAYVEAGRLAEARTLLEAGEHMRRRLITEVRAGRAPLDRLRETERPRAKLMRSLGLEPIPMPPPATPR